MRGAVRVGVDGSSGPGPGPGTDIGTAGLPLVLVLLVAIGTAVSNALSGGIQKLGRPVEVMHLSDADQISAVLTRIRYISSSEVYLPAAQQSVLTGPATAKRNDQK